MDETIGDGNASLQSKLRSSEEVNDQSDRIAQILVRDTRHPSQITILRGLGDKHASSVFQEKLSCLDAGSVFLVKG